MIYEVFYEAATADGHIDKAALIVLDDDLEDNPDIDIIDAMDEAIIDQTGDVPGAVFFTPAIIGINPKTGVMWIDEPHFDTYGKEMKTRRAVTDDELDDLRYQLGELTAKQTASA